MNNSSIRPRVAQRDALSCELALGLLLAMCRISVMEPCPSSWKPPGDMGEAICGADWLTISISLRNPWARPAMHHLHHSFGSSRVIATT